MKKSSLILFFIIIFISIIAKAAITPPAIINAPAVITTNPEQIHAQLRQLKDSAVAAINSGNFDQILPLIHPNIVVTAENAEVVRKRSGVEQFYKNLLTGPNHPLKSFHIEHLNVDELSILYGNVAIAFGSGIFDYQFTDGSEFKLPCRWTAVLVQENNQWFLAAFHNSVNLVDNPVLDTVRTKMYWIAAAALVLGIIIGAFLGWLFVRR